MSASRVDLRLYAERVLSPEDRPLFDEAVEAASAGALRAAYVMIWLSCAESLKRRFNEAKRRDNTAGKIVGEMNRMEAQQKAVDRFLLDRAREYGILSATGHTLLKQVYEMRCIYGHPYEEAPSPEKVMDGAATVIEQVLSQPVKLREGYGRQLLRSLLEERNFLDDQESAVSAFTKDVLRRIDDNIHVWLLNECWEELEKLSDDPSMAVFLRRGVWFSSAMLSVVGTTVMAEEDWHVSCGRFPKTLMRVCSVAELFRSLGELAQNSLVGSVLDESRTHAAVLTYLERLNNAGELSQRQQERFLDHISRMKISDIRVSGLSTKTCYDKLVDAIKSYDWYIQNPAINAFISNGPDQAARLTEDQQVNLGRNILQAAEGRARSASGFLNRLADESNWPTDIVRGIVLESFTNESNEIRPKDRRIKSVLSVLDQFDEEPRNKIVAEAMASIDAGTPQDWVVREDLDSTFEALSNFGWAEPLANSLESKFPDGGNEEG